MIPLFHDFRGERVLVFGGGRVGYRKARRFAREATVVVVGAEFADEFREFAEHRQSDEQGACASLVRAHVSPGDVDSWLERVAPALVVAATSDEECNAAIERAASERGILVNRADRSGERELGSVVVPATARDGDVVVAVGTGGRSPALSKELRKRIEPELEGAETVAAVTSDLREALKRRDVPPHERRRAVRAVVESDAVWNAEDEKSARKEADAVVDRILE